MDTCRRGHPRTEENTRIVGKRRFCRICQADSARRYRACPDWPRPAGGDTAHVTRLMLYGLRNGGLPNIPPEKCREWLES